MGKKIFEGELKQMDPAKLVNIVHKNELEETLLAFAYIYNEFKGYTFFYVNFLESHAPSSGSNEPKYHDGEFDGFSYQMTRVVCSALWEFLDFIETNVKILDSAEFKKIVQATDPKTQSRWQDLYDIAMKVPSQLDQSNELANALEKIRHNVTFHYKHVGQNLRPGFIRFFFSNEKINKNKYAYYAFGESMRTSRFFYADAAVQGYAQQFTIPPKDIEKLLTSINIVLQRIMQTYLESL